MLWEAIEPAELADAAKFSGLITCLRSGRLEDLLIKELVKRASNIAGIPPGIGIDDAIGEITVALIHRTSVPRDVESQGTFADALCVANILLCVANDVPLNESPGLWLLANDRFSDEVKALIKKYLDGSR